MNYELTLFALKVYKTVLTIPLGEVRTYKWVAQKSGRPRAYRAVGQILKRNPCPLLVPCHRVIKSSSEPGGYIFGPKRKKSLLDLEKQIKKVML